MNCEKTKQKFKLGKFTQGDVFYEKQPFLNDMFNHYITIISVKDSEITTIEGRGANLSLKNYEVNDFIHKCKYNTRYNNSSIILDDYWVSFMENKKVSQTIMDSQIGMYLVDKKMTEASIRDNKLKQVFDK